LKALPERSEENDGRNASRRAGELSERLRDGAERVAALALTALAVVLLAEKVLTSP
jgi:hypothetical protein